MELLSLSKSIFYRQLDPIGFFNTRCIAEELLSTETQRSPLRSSEMTQRSTRLGPLPGELGSFRDRLDFLRPQRIHTVQPTLWVAVVARYTGASGSLSKPVQSVYRNKTQQENLQIVRNWRAKGMNTDFVVQGIMSSRVFPMAFWQATEATCQSLTVWITASVQITCPWWCHTTLRPRY